MFSDALRSLLLSLWRFSIVYSVLIIGWLYCRITGQTFAEIDDGISQHKLIIIGLYLAYLGVWLLVNPRLSRIRRPY
ncbi:hypothetical protein ACVFI8_08870 [Agarivorans sp. MS3-6]|uniref:hypothetical protein n=1 Tax=Agarivorans sp. TSD2052 TaxID=2937286 RepID=UPI0020106BE3|nr:hypothetical protein [Agarivorans sp. TSD2052]UPW18904.1 hypothetical protein M0C34_01100 [Agarivorans sp. TSD2052]